VPVHCCSLAIAWPLADEIYDVQRRRSADEESVLWLMRRESSSPVRKVSGCCQGPTRSKVRDKELQLLNVPSTKLRVVHYSSGTTYERKFP